MKELKAVVFKPKLYDQMIDINTLKSKSHQYKTIKDDLNEFYDIINCDTIDIVKRKIGNKYYCIICDDEALLKDSPKIALTNRSDHHKNVYGNIIITGEEDDAGELTSLSISDANEIAKHIRVVILQPVIGGKTCFSEVLVI